MLFKFSKKLEKENVNCHKKIENDTVFICSFGIEMSLDINQGNIVFMILYF